MLGPTLDTYYSTFAYLYTWDFVACDLERRAEISVDIFARLLPYFRLSCKKFTIND